MNAIQEFAGRLEMIFSANSRRTVNYLAESLIRTQQTGSTAITVGALLAGCCAVFPCHRGTHVTGFVVDSKSRPVANASVALFGSHVLTGEKGCFTFNLADGLPFQLVVTSPGHKSIASDVQYGFFQVDVALSPNEATAPSEITWRELTESKFTSASENCSQ